MLSKEQITSLREHLERAQNPLFFYDNDADGLCAYLILKKSIDKGKGVAIKAFPNLPESYLSRIDEFNADYVFILDYSIISREFVEGLILKNIPLVIIDHHEIKDLEYLQDKAEIFNSFPSSEPTTYLCYKTFEKKENQWLAMVGCISDVYKPDFGKEFAKNNPELYDNELTPFQARYSTQVGKIARMLTYGLKDSTTNIMKIVRLLEKANSAIDILNEDKDTLHLHKKYQKVNEYIEKTIKKVKKISEKLLILEYAGENSMSSEISNYLYYQNKEKIILVSFKKSDYCNISIRGKGVKEILSNAIKDIPGASGGGHDEACGGRIPTDNWEDFKEKVISLAK